MFDVGIPTDTNQLQSHVLETVQDFGVSGVKLTEIFFVRMSIFDSQTNGFWSCWVLGQWKPVHAKIGFYINAGLKLVARW